MASETTRLVQELRAAIHGGRFLPGEQLRQEALAEEFGVSRVPLREALLVLADNGLLEHRNNQGFRVAKRSAEELAQLLWLIEVLETRVYERMPWPGAAQLREYDRLNRAMAAVRGRDSATFSALNEQFHTAIWRNSPEPVIVGELEKTWSLVMPSLGPYYAREASRAGAVREHQRIIDALRAKDRGALHQAEAAHRWTELPSDDRPHR